MAVVNNTLSEIGDVITISPKPYTGLLSITGFTETVSGQSATRFFVREFKYSLDGVNWSDKQILSVANLSAIPITPKMDFLIEITYTRQGTDNTGLLVFGGVTLNTTSITWDSGQTYNNSIFKRFFESNDDEVIEWSLNLLNKLYRKGIVPAQLTRGFNENKNEEDRDYIDFWRICSSYWALLVKYSGEFEDFSNNRELLLKYLRHRGVFLCEQTPLADLQYIMQNFWDEMRHRGTLMVAKPKDEVINGTPKPVHGELLRLLCYNPECNEFIFGISEFNRIGWVGNEWSPLYQGLTDQTQFNKFYEKYKNVSDLTKYPLLNPGNIAPSLFAGIPETNTLLLANPGVMRVGVTTGQLTGVGTVGYDANFAINVNPELDYELSFYVRIATGSPKISVRAFGYDTGGVGQDMYDVSTAAFNVSNDMIVEVDPLANGWMYVRCAIFGTNHAFNADPAVTTPSITVGNNLKMSPDVCKIIPQIVVDDTSSTTNGSVLFWNMRLAPLKTDYSTGFLNTANLIQTWIQNNSSNTQAQIEEIMRYYLLPYQTILINNYL